MKKRKKKINNVRILKVESLNLSCKNEYTKKVIMENYTNLLNSLQIPLLISCKSEHIDKINNINDNKLNEFINNYIKQNNIIDKYFYLILNHSNNIILNSAFKTIEKYLKNMNLYFEEVERNNYYEWNKIQDLNRKYVKYDNYYYKTLWINDWPNYATFGWLEFLYNMDENIDINCYIKPYNKIWSTKFLKKKLLQYRVNTDIEEEKNGDDEIYNSQLKSISCMLDEIRSNSGKFFTMSFYITIKGKTKEELQNNYINIKNLLIGEGIQSFSCYLNEHNVLKNNFNYKDGLMKEYNFTTNSLKAFIPFLSYNIYDKEGIYVAKNLANNNLIFLDIFKRQYAILLILGVMGSGKSFLAKNLIANMANNGIMVDVFDRIGEYKIAQHMEKNDIMPLPANYPQEKKDKNDSEKVIKKLTNTSNIKIHQYNNLKRYIDELRKYIDKVNEDYKNNKSIPRFLLVDEYLAFVLDRQYGLEFSKLFNEIMLEGRKKYLGFGAICQNITPLIQNKNSESWNCIIENSNIKFLMKMSMNEAKTVAEQYDLNEQQINFLSTAIYEGLMMVDSNCVPFKVETSQERNELFNTDPHK